MTPVEDQQVCEKKQIYATITHVDRTAHRGRLKATSKSNSGPRERKHTTLDLKTADTSHAVRDLEAQRQNAFTC